LENLASLPARSVIAVNHVSFLDAAIMLSLMDEPPAFTTHAEIARHWWVRLFLRFVGSPPIDPTRRLASRALIEEVRQGRPLVVFPEDRITVTGGVMKTYDQAAFIADRADAFVTPVRMIGAERTYFSRISAARVGRRFLPRITV